MDTSKLIPILMLASFSLIFFRRLLAKRRLAGMNISKDAVIIDVRSPAEFSSGHVDRSVNIPLGDLASQLKKLNTSKMTVVCCASGFRSAQAAKLLKQSGFTSVQDAGSWRNLR